MVTHGARFSKVLTGLHFGPTLLNLFLINIPKDNTNPLTAVSADAVVVAQDGLWLLTELT